MHFYRKSGKTALIRSGMGFEYQRHAVRQRTNYKTVNGWVKRSSSLNAGERAQNLYLHKVKVDFA